MGRRVTGIGHNGGFRPGVAAAGKVLNSKLQTGDVNPGDTPTFYSVIERDQFEGKMENLADVIAKEAGVQIRQSGGLGSYAEVSIRGSSSEQVMVYMDGILLNDASGGGVNLSNIALDDVQNIEIYRGVTPVNFGKASIGGVVNIRTLRAEKGFKANIGAGYGSFNTRKANAFINHKPGKWDYVVSADWLSSDNDFEFTNTMGTDQNSSDDRWEKRHNAWFRQYNLLAKAGYDFTKDFRIDLVNQYFSKDQGLPSLFNWPEVDSTFRTKRNISTLRFTWNNLTDLDLNTALKFNYNWKEEEYDDRDGWIGLGRDHTVYTTTRFGGSLFAEWPTTYQLLSFNGEFYNENYKPVNLMGTEDFNRSSRRYASIALQDSLLLFGKHLIISPAIRSTWINDHLDSGEDAHGGPTYETRDKNKQYWSPQLGLKYKPWQWLTIKGNIARYVREPSFFELFGDRGFFLGNDELKAEDGVNYDLGFSVNLFPKDAWVNRFSWGAAYFISDVQDLITRVYDARGVGRSVNISQSYITGLETDVKVDFFKYFSVSGNATWQKPENRSEISAFDGKILPGRFTQSFYGKAEAKYQGWKIYSEYIFEDGRYYDTANLVKAKPKREWNAGISYLYHSWLFSLEGKNLKAEEYEDFHRFPLPGRSFFFHVKKEF